MAAPAPSAEISSCEWGWQGRPIVIALLLIAAILPYLNTFDVPWYFDDTNNIVDNPLIRDLPRALRGIFEGRGLAVFTFALNHRFGGLDPTGYHLVNLAIHALTVLAVWRLLLQLPPISPGWAVTGALFFAVHPLQTQAVTYVVQRMTSLSALFFIAATCCYLDYLDSTGRHRRFCYLMALGSGVLAVLTKENTAILPVVLLLIERIARPGRGWREQLVALAPFLLAPLWKVVELLLLPQWQGGVAVSVHYADQLLNLQNVTPARYLFTEFPVLWYYLKLLVLPVGQVLDYGWPVVDSLLNPLSLAALAGLVVLWGTAWRLHRRRPLLALGIAWFFVTLSIESSIIPLDPVFEHRLYLPMVGFVLVLLDLLPRVPWPKGRVAAVAVIVSLLSLLTWQRNALWGDAVDFLEDNLRRRPDNVRVMVMLGNAYAAAKRPEDGMRLLEQAMQLNQRYDFAYTARGKMLIDQGRGGDAIPFLLKGADLFPTSVQMHEYLGIAYGQVGELQKALEHFRQALQLNPDDASIYTNLGVVYSWMGDNRQAADYFEKSLRLAPDSEQALFNYATTLFNLGDQPGALDALRRVVEVNPANADAWYGRATLALEAGHRKEAGAARDVLRQLGDERAGELGVLLSTPGTGEKR